MAASSQPGLRVTMATGNDTATAAITRTSPAYTPPRQDGVPDLADHQESAEADRAPPPTNTIWGHCPQCRPKVRVKT